MVPEGFKKSAGEFWVRPPISEVAEYLEVVRQLGSWWQPSPQLWFRGVSRASYRLVPSLYRSPLWEQYQAGHLETVLVDAFVRRAKPFVDSGQIYSWWDWYHLMQHHGMPTRLLDWTGASLVGLYFAVRFVGDRKTPTVWVMGPSWLNRFQAPQDVYSTDPMTRDPADAEFQELYTGIKSPLPEHPVALLPGHAHPRIRAQDSVFTVSGSIRYGIEALCREHPDAQLAKLRIRARAAIAIRRELDSMGINEGVLFPDLDGLARQIFAEMAPEPG